MRIVIAAVGQRMPAWVQSGWDEYARRIPRNFSLSLKEIPMVKRGNNSDIAAAREKESAALLTAMPAGACIVALDEGGKQWSTAELAGQLEQWMQSGRDLGFMIGGPDGLDAASLQKAERRWSLGRLTLPHPLVRVVLIEALYRAWTVTQNHPYHRA